MTWSSRPPHDTSGELDEWEFRRGLELLNVQLSDVQVVGGSVDRRHGATGGLVRRGGAAWGGRRPRLARRDRATSEPVGLGRVWSGSSAQQQRARAAPGARRRTFGPSARALRPRHRVGTHARSFVRSLVVRAARARFVLSLSLPPALRRRRRRATTTRAPGARAVLVLRFRPFGDDRVRRVRKARHAAQPPGRHGGQPQGHHDDARAQRFSSIAHVKREGARAEEPRRTRRRSRRRAASRARWRPCARTSARQKCRRMGATCSTTSWTIRRRRSSRRLWGAPALVASAARRFESNAQIQNVAK